MLILRYYHMCFLPYFIFNFSRTKLLSNTQTYAEYNNLPEKSANLSSHESAVLKATKETACHVTSNLKLSILISDYFKPLMWSYGAMRCDCVWVFSSVYEWLDCKKCYFHCLNTFILYRWVKFSNKMLNWSLFAS